MLNASPKTCPVVGGHGYLGGELRQYLSQAGFRILTTSRQPQNSTYIRYSLDDDFPPDLLNGIEALIHCAYDFRPVAWNDIYRQNVDGTQRLLKQATRAGGLTPRSGHFKSIVPLVG